MAENGNISSPKPNVEQDLQNLREFQRQPGVNGPAQKAVSKCLMLVATRLKRRFQQTMSKEDCEDAAADSMEKIIRLLVDPGKCKFDGTRGPLAAYLYVVMRNDFRNWYQNIRLRRSKDESLDAESNVDGIVALRDRLSTTGVISRDSGEHRSPVEQTVMHLEAHNKITVVLEKLRAGGGLTGAVARAVLECETEFKRNGLIEIQSLLRHIERTAPEVLKGFGYKYGAVNRAWTEVRRRVVAELEWDIGIELRTT